MLFNSYIYLILFLPIVAIVFRFLIPRHHSLALSWLTVASLFFYGYWEPALLLLIGGSCVVNHLIALWLNRESSHLSHKTALTLGVVFNLSLLGWFKYAGFFATTYNAITEQGITVPEIVLPLAISFFTFQQIAYIVDVRRNIVSPTSLRDHFLFIGFFPQLIAGPIVHRREVMPQFLKLKNIGLRRADIAVGLTLLTIGLFKKVVIADSIAKVSSPLFDFVAGGGRPLTIAEAWSAALSYSMQIYFDFSGYADIAIGSARLFGIKLPLNFNSPYKASSVIDFWKRWHITLSRFLRDYLYIPLGGSRCSQFKRNRNLFLTMLLGGLWHGAGWTFIAWGTIHGLLLLINHSWRKLTLAYNLPRIPKMISIGITFLCVVVTWVFFRAADIRSALSILESMIGMNGFEGWPERALQIVKESRGTRFIPLLLACWFLPNAYQLTRRYRPAYRLSEYSFSRSIIPKLRWKPSIIWILFTLALIYSVGREFDAKSEFIYFQF